jgi:NAD(P)-dependent dehydrogenase (short-subunit alcohol dehydrogenase family)
VELQLLDLSKFSSVIAFADNFLKDGSRLDLLVANAAVSTSIFKTTDDGWEESYVHSPHTLVTNLIGNSCS